MLKRMEIFLITVMFVLITAIILITYTMQRAQEFRSHQNTIQQSSVHGASYAINRQLLNKHRHVRLFLDEYAQLFSRLSFFPMDEKTSGDIKRRLQQRFPDFFTYTISNAQGIPILLDMDSLVGEACQNDLKQFSNSVKMNSPSLPNKVFIHPQPFNYHFDIMAPLKTKAGNLNLFFASFYVKEITDILKTHEIPGQKLMLVKQSDPSLIEVTKQGTRDKLSREINLSTEEQRRIRVYENIPNTNWRLVALADAKFEKKYLYGLWKEAFIIIAIVSLALLLLAFVLIKLSKRRMMD
ncbi:MAG TPA: hypothetical protein EYG68_03340 [Leucothrix mucor]|nr:hypothetical protein [Leucothrix mucor]